MWHQVHVSVRNPGTHTWEGLWWLSSSPRVRSENCLSCKKNRAAFRMSPMRPFGPGSSDQVVVALAGSALIPSWGHLWQAVRLASRQMDRQTVKGFPSDVCFPSNLLYFPVLQTGREELESFIFILKPFLFDSKQQQQQEASLMSAKRGLSGQSQEIFWVRGKAAWYHQAGWQWESPAATPAPLVSSSSLRAAGTSRSRVGARRFVFLMRDIYRMLLT